jgi:hypothetical protein
MGRRFWGYVEVLRGSGVALVLIWLGLLVVYCLRPCGSYEEIPGGLWTFLLARTPIPPAGLGVIVASLANSYSRQEI